MTTDPLFEVAPTMARTARLSPCGTYRYELTRAWADGPTATFVMLNPSTADAQLDDPTIRRCVGFARSWGCGSLTVANLYALRATDPRALWSAEDPVGPDNDAHLARVIMRAARAQEPLVAAWGAHARPDRIARVLALPAARDAMKCLGLTVRTGAPRHPLYLPARSRLRPLVAAGRDAAPARA